MENKKMEKTEWKDKAEWVDLIGECLFEMRGRLGSIESKMEDLLNKIAAPLTVMKDKEDLEQYRKIMGKKFRNTKNFKDMDL